MQRNMGKLHIVGRIIYQCQHLGVSPEFALRPLLSAVVHGADKVRRVGVA